MSEFINSYNESFHLRLDSFLDHAVFFVHTLTPLTNIAVSSANEELIQFRFATLPSEYPALAMALAIAVGAAIFSSGLDAMVKTWFGNNWVNRRFLMFTEVLSASGGFILGVLAGAQIWNPVLGGLCGLVGGASSPFFVKKINAVFKFWSDRKSKSK